MILAIISAIFCFAAAILMFTPFFRKIVLLRPAAIYLLFQGVWILLSYALLQLNPNNGFIFPINYIATIAVVAYYIFVMVMVRFNKDPDKIKKSRRNK